MADERLVVFLDQNHWCDLAAAEKPAAVTALDALLTGVRSGNIMVPLGAVHYWETWHRREWRSRHRLAGVMRDVSSYTTITSMDRLLRSEVDAAFRRRVGLPVTPIEAIGWGVRHAFDHPLGRIRLINDPEDDGPGEEPTEEIRDAIRKLDPLGFEFWSLAGPSADFDEVTGVDTVMRHRLGNRHVQDQQALAEHLAAHAPPGRFDDCVIAEWLHALWPHFMAVAQAVDLSPTLAIGPPPRGLHWLVEDVPTAHVWCQLDQRLLRDRSYRWHQHDLNDMFSLSAATAHADIVVTEKHWAHHLRTTTVAQRRGVHVLKNLDQLLSLLRR